MHQQLSAASEALSGGHRSVEASTRDDTGATVWHAQDQQLAERVAALRQQLADAQKIAALERQLSEHARAQAALETDDVRAHRCPPKVRLLVCVKAAASVSARRRSTCGARPARACMRAPAGSGRLAVSCSRCPRTRPGLARQRLQLIRRALAAPTAHPRRPTSLSHVTLPHPVRTCIRARTRSLRRLRGVRRGRSRRR